MVTIIPLIAEYTVFIMIVTCNIIIDMMHGGENIVKNFISREKDSSVFEIVKDFKLLDNGFIRTEDIFAVPLTYLGDFSERNNFYQLFYENICINEENDDNYSDFNPDYSKSWKMIICPDKIAHSVYWMIKKSNIKSYDVNLFLKGNISFSKIYKRQSDTVKKEFDHMFLSNFSEKTLIIGQKLLYTLIHSNISFNYIMKDFTTFILFNELLNKSINDKVDYSLLYFTNENKDNEEFSAYVYNSFNNVNIEVNDYTVSMAHGIFVDRILRKKSVSVHHSNMIETDFVEYDTYKNGIVDVDFSIMSFLDNYHNMIHSQIKSSDIITAFSTNEKDERFYYSPYSILNNLGSLNNTVINNFHNSQYDFALSNTKTIDIEEKNHVFNETFKFIEKVRKLECNHTIEENINDVFYHIKKVYYDTYVNYKNTNYIKEVTNVSDIDYFNYHNFPVKNYGVYFNPLNFFTIIYLISKISSSINEKIPTDYISDIITILISRKKNLVYTDYVDDERIEYKIFFTNIDYTSLDNIAEIIVDSDFSIPFSLIANVLIVLGD